MIQQIYKSLHLQKFWTWSTQCYPHWRWHTEMNDVCTPCNFLVWGPLSWETSLWILSCWNSHVSKIMFIYIHANNKAFFFFLNKCNSSSLLSIFIKTHTKIALKVSGKRGGGEHKHKKMDWHRSVIFPPQLISMPCHYIVFKYRVMTSLNLWLLTSPNNNWACLSCCTGVTNLHLKSHSILSPIMLIRQISKLSEKFDKSISEHT